jgi:hypothetical protein
MEVVFLLPQAGGDCGVRTPAACRVATRGAATRSMEPLRMTPKRSITTI